MNRSGNCRRVTRITADLNLKVIDMHMDIEVNYRRVLADRFLLRKVSAVPLKVSEAVQ